MIRYKKLTLSTAKQYIERYNIRTTLATRRSPFAAQQSIETPIKTWQIFKGLPAHDLNNRPIAQTRRSIAKNILKSLKDIHYVFEMDINGDLVFLEPFRIQKDITSFNYEFRDYLRLVQLNRATAISEGYISHDPERTQIITIATPIFDKAGHIARIFATSVSAQTLRDRVLRSIHEFMDVRDGTTFYLIDRHGHVVASSSGRNIYFPTTGRINDEHDLGNLRATGFFQHITWHNDILEKGNIWERHTKSWHVDTLAKHYSGEYTNLNGISVFATLFPTSIIDSGVANWGILVETPVDQLLASKASLKQTYYISTIILLIILLILCGFTIRGFNQLKAQLHSKQLAIAQITAQVAHDIRSPLVALDIVSSNLSELPSDKRLIAQGAINRIKDIANKLLDQNRLKSPQLTKVPADADDQGTQLLSDVIDGIVIEKQVEYRFSRPDFKIKHIITEEDHGIFANTQPLELERIISNLINNAIEASDKDGSTTISYRRSKNATKILITDNGRGIPKEILPRIMEYGFTFNKPLGSGLGLFHAKKSIEGWGGKLSIDSSAEQGTTVTISLPTTNTPDWFPTKLILCHDHKIIIVAGPAIAQKLRTKISQTGPSQKDYDITHLSNSKELRTWTQLNTLNPNFLIILSDEISEDTHSALDLISELNLQNASILVTSRYDDQIIQSRCMEIGVPLLPRNLVEVIPISYQTRLESFDSILIDDDPLVRMSWSSAARAKNKNLRVSASPKEFIDDSDSIERSTTIFIDSHLAEGIRGEIEARRLFMMGFRNIFLATADINQSVSTMPWIKDIVGKSPPW